jgi:hypothetical protein
MDLTPRRQSVSQVAAHAPRLEKVKQEFKQKSTSRLEPKGNWGLVNNDTKQESTPMPRRQPAPQEAVRNPRDNIPPRRQSQGFKKKPVLRLKPEGNWSIVRSITALLFSLIAAKAIETNAVNLENKEIFLSHLKGTDIHPVGFNQEAMVMAYNCYRSTKQEAVFLVPSQFRGNPKSQEDVVQRTIVFMPRPEEHEMFVYKVSLSIQGGVCDFTNLQYQNILNNDDN